HERCDGTGGDGERQHGRRHHRSCQRQPPDGGRADAARREPGHGQHVSAPSAGATTWPTTTVWVVTYCPTFKMSPSCCGNGSSRWPFSTWFTRGGSPV